VEGMRESMEVYYLSREYEGKGEVCYLSGGYEGIYSGVLLQWRV